jgi:hypothetical protein
MPGSRTPNLDTNTLLTTTLGYYSRNIVDNAFSQLPFLYWLRQVRKKLRVDGGEPITVPLEYGFNTTIQFITKRSKLDTTAYDPLMEAKFYWSLIGGTLVIPSFDIEVLNKGSAKLIDLLQPYVRNTEKSFAKILSNAILGSRGTDPLKIWGLADVIDSSDPAYGAYGDISRSTYTWWQANEQTYVSSDGLLANVNHLYNTLVDGAESPDIALCGQTVYEKYEALLPSHLQYTDVRLAETKFHGIKHGMMTIMMDKGLDALGATNVMYMINADYIDLVEAEGWNPRLGDFVEMPDEPTRVAKLLWSGQLVCSNCQKQGKLTGIS